MNFLSFFLEYANEVYKCVTCLLSDPEKENKQMLQADVFTDKSGRICCKGLAIIKTREDIYFFLCL